MIELLQSVLPSKLWGVNSTKHSGFVCANPACFTAGTVWDRVRSRRSGAYINGLWFCRESCFRAGLLQQLEARRQPPPAVHSTKSARMPLGLILLSQNVIDQSTLREALARQSFSSGARVGEILLAMGAVAEDDVLKALAIQNGCPVFRQTPRASTFTSGSIPEAAARHFEAVPVHYNLHDRKLLVGFGGSVSYAFLHALEYIAACEASACIVPARTVREGLERLSQQSPAVNTHQVADLTEGARIVSSYAEKLGADACRMTHCGAQVWTRFIRCNELQLDLLLRVGETERPLRH